MGDEDGEETLEEVLNQATPAPGGRLRGSLSEFLSGPVLGGWSYSGTNDRDLNDVIDHRDRREVRGQYVLSAWLNHVDARDQNNMDMWVETGEDVIDLIASTMVYEGREGGFVAGPSVTPTAITPDAVAGARVCPPPPPIPRAPPSER